MTTPDISQRMREVREENQLTQHAMALKLGINQRKLSRMEANPKKFDHYVIAKMSKEFGVSSRWIIEGDGPKYEEAPVTHSQEEFQQLESVCESLKIQVAQLQAQIALSNKTIAAQEDLLNVFRNGIQTIANSGTDNVGQERINYVNTTAEQPEHNREIHVSDS